MITPWESGLAKRPPPAPLFLTSTNRWVRHTHWPGRSAPGTWSRNSARPAAVRTAPSFIPIRKGSVGRLERAEVDRPPEGKGIAWRGTVPPQKWMNFSTKVLSRFVATPGLKLEMSSEGSPGEGATEAKREETKAALRELGLAEDLGPRSIVLAVRDVV